MDEIALPRGRGGSEVARSARGVHRTTGAWTETVHLFLRHLEACGFAGAPRVLGFDDQGREVLTYLEGDVLADPSWEPGDPGRWPDYAQSEDALVAAARLLRELHAAARSFVPPPDACWKQYDWPMMLPGEIVCHGDVGRHNTVYRDGLPVAFIDWEAIRPNEPVIEFGSAAWNFVPLAPSQYFERSEFRSPPDLDTRLSLFAREYGLRDRSRVLRGVQQARQRHVEVMRHWVGISAEDAASTFRLLAEELEWFQMAQDRLATAL